MQTSNTFFSTQLLLCVQKIQIESREIKKLTRVHSLASLYYCIQPPQKKMCIKQNCNNCPILISSLSVHLKFFSIIRLLCKLLWDLLGFFFFPLSSFETDRQPKKCPIAFLHFCHWGCSYIFYSLAKRKKIGK